MTDSGEPHVPADGREPEPASGAGDRGGLPLVAPDGDGLRWSFELDLVSALEAIGRPLRDWHGVDQEEDLAAEVAALGFTDVPPDPADGPPGQRRRPGTGEQRRPATRRQPGWPPGQPHPWHAWARPPRPGVGQGGRASRGGRVYC